MVTRTPGCLLTDICLKVELTDFDQVLIELVPNDDVPFARSPSRCQLKTCLDDSSE